MILSHPNPWIGTSLMAAVAALGYWVLRHAVKDQGKVRIAGTVVGWVLVVGGLLGFACGITMHSIGSCCKTHGGKRGESIKMDMTLPPLPLNHPPLDIPSK